MGDWFCASEGSAATVSWSAFGAACATPARVSSPARPAASRDGLTMPVLTALPLVTVASTVCQVTGLSGQPSCLATGSGAANTTGLEAIDGGLTPVFCLVAAASRASQSDESGTQTSGICALPLAWPRPVRAGAPAAAARVVATSAGSAATTVTATHCPVVRELAQVLPVLWIAGAMSGEAATVSVSGLP